MIERRAWGDVDGLPVHLFTLSNGRLTLRATNYGAIVTELRLPDGTDVVLGLRDLAAYVEKNPYFGCVAGRCANRIAHGRFELDGRRHQLSINNGPHHLHGGTRGFDRRVWDAEADGTRVLFTRTSPDGEEGYPGAVRASVEYRLDEDAFVVEMTATADAPTLVNLAHHSYWNLAGAGTILDHVLTIDAESYTPVDATLIPTGELAGVEGTPFDFRRPKRVGAELSRVPGGYDHNFAFKGLARLEDPSSGRVMELRCDEPGLQLYTGNFLDGTSKGKGGATYPKHAGLCLETQKFPDAIHHPGWIAPVLRPGETYRHAMLHRFPEITRSFSGNPTVS
ncbi:MAG TPA: aldose epimerase family protein [Planctomycetota bacterium]|nr:aldose epimerase family protein [Planctomycetota bacterium]